MPSYVTEESFLELVRPVFENIGLDIDEVLINNTGDQNITSPTSQEQSVSDVVQSLNTTPSNVSVVTQN